MSGLLRARTPCSSALAVEALRRQVSKYHARALALSVLVHPRVDEYRVGALCECAHVSAALVMACWRQDDPLTRLWRAGGFSSSRCALGQRKLAARLVAAWQLGRQGERASALRRRSSSSASAVAAVF